MMRQREAYIGSWISPEYSMARACSVFRFRQYLTLMITTNCIFHDDDDNKRVLYVGMMGFRLAFQSIQQTPFERSEA